MRLIHCADLHLNSKMTANLSKEQAKARKAEILHTFTRMVDYAVRNDVRVILIAGDLFDTRNISATARNTVQDAISMHPQIDFLYLKGNHDEDNFLSNLEHLPENLKLFSKEWTSYDYDGIKIYGLELARENQASAYNSLVLSYDDYNIVTLHGQESLYGAKDQAEVIHLSELKNKNIDYLALGHIHSYKREVLDARAVYCYSGCLEGRGFDECGSKGFVLLDIDNNTHQAKETFVPFAHRMFYELEVDCTEVRTTSQALERIHEAIAKAALDAGSLVKIVLTGNVDVESQIDIQYLTKVLEGQFYFEKVKDQTKVEIDYEVYRMDASLKGEFIRMVEASDLEDEMKPQVIRCGIMALSGEEL